jgi:peptidyl-prolyl cis-trans isomerase C
VVHRSEFDDYERPDSGSPDVQISDAEETDWRVSSITEIVIRKFLAEEVAADDPGLPAAVQQATTGVLIGAMRDAQGWDQLTVAPEELREYFDSHPEQYRDPKIARAEHIYLRAEDAVLAPEQRKAIRDRLEGIRQEILSGADFTEMIRLHSESDDADRGGVMTLKADARVFPAFAEAVWALEIGEVSEVIDIPTGFQLVKMKEIIPAAQQEFADMTEFIRRARLAEKTKEAQGEFVREAGERHGLERHYERLSDPHISEDDTLVVIGDVSYRFRDLRNELPQALRSHLYGAYFPEVHEYLDEVVLNLLLLKEAERLQLVEQEEIVAQVELAVAELRYQRALDTRLQKKAAEVPDDALREFYDQNKLRFKTLHKQDLDVILVKHEPDSPFWATLRRAEEIVGRIRAGEDFAELARAHSAHYSASNGGRMEGLTDTAVGDMVHGRPAFRAQLKKLAEGEVADPMVAEAYDRKKLRYTRTGVIIVRVVKVYPPEQAPFEEVRELVRSNYQRRNYQRFEAEIRDEVLAAAAIEIYFDNLPPI